MKEFFYCLPLDLNTHDVLHLSLKSSIALGNAGYGVKRAKTSNQDKTKIKYRV